MKISRIRVLGLVGLVLALVGGSVSAQAAEPLSPVITIKGHVTDREGEPLSGIRVEAWFCGCDAYVLDRYASGSDTTNSSGFYSFKVRKSFVTPIFFSDPNSNYFSKRKPRPSTTTRTGGYVIDARLEKVSIIEGTAVSSADGRPAYPYVELFDAATGRAIPDGAYDSDVDNDGHFVARVRAGSYRLRFGGNFYYLHPIWYGQVTDRAQSPTVTVGYGETVSDINVVVTPKPTISGTFTFDGKKPPASVSRADEIREALYVELFDQNGKRVDGFVTRDRFSFVELTPGSYTVKVRPTVHSGAYVQPVTQTIDLAPGTAIDNLVINLTTNPATATETRSTQLEFVQTSRGFAKPGKKLTGKILVSSYGDVARGKIAIYVNGKKVDTRTVPASGRINWEYTLPREAKDKFVMTVKFLGTETARSRSTVVYELYYS